MAKIAGVEALAAASVKNRLTAAGDSRHYTAEIEQLPLRRAPATVARVMRSELGRDGGG